MPPCRGGDSSAGDRAAAGGPEPGRQAARRGEPREPRPRGLRSGGRLCAWARHAWEGEGRGRPRRPPRRGAPPVPHVWAERPEAHGRWPGAPRAGAGRRPAGGSHRQAGAPQRPRRGSARVHQWRGPLRHRPQRGPRRRRRFAHRHGGRPAQPRRHEPRGNRRAHAHAPQDQLGISGGSLHHPGHRLCARLHQARLHSAPGARPVAHLVGLHQTHEGMDLGPAPSHPPGEHTVAAEEAPGRKPSRRP
mmetsp:Transcript_32650/g.77446  ORF Transcript_32650/g.77446 Transcript_32650/m.77446 type:complete len:247 (-) Transcript_32650:1532-2272(-)